MKGKFISIITASILVLCVSCSNDESSIDTSKAIRTGNFLASANFSDLSVLNIKNQGNVKSLFKDNVAMFEYSNGGIRKTTKSTASLSSTEISFFEPVMVELTPGTYTTSFEYYFDTEDDLEVHQAMQNIKLLLEFTPVPLTEDLIPTSVMPIEMGGRDEVMKKEWAKYEKKT